MAQSSPHFLSRNFNMLEIHASTDRDVVAGLRAWWSFSLSQLDAGGGNERVVICSLEMLMVDIGVKNEGIREPARL